MIKIFRVIGYFLERYERDNPRIFWFVTILLALRFSSFDDRSLIRFQTTQTPAVIEKNVKNVLAINSGGDERTSSHNFVPNDPISRRSASDRGNDRLHDYNPKPRFPWGIDPSFSGSGSGGGSAGGSLDDNNIPPKSEWETYPNFWDNYQNEAQEETCSTSEEDKKIQPPGKLQVDLDFPYRYDDNGNPTLLVPKIGRARKKRPYTKVDFDQTASHMHHAPDFGIVLPQDFEMAKYQGLDRDGRIEYEKQKLPQEIIINYQNEIGKSMSPVFGVNTKSVPGFAGVRKQETELTIQSTKPNKNILGILREDGMHISSFSITDDKLKAIAKNDFWILKDRNL